MNGGPLLNTLAPLERERILRLAIASKFQKKSTSLPTITTTRRGDRMPLSFAQQRLWFLAQMEGGSRAYHVPVRLELKGVLHRSALHRTLDRILARHEALRTCFYQIDGEPFQRIHSVEDSRFMLLEHDLSSHPDRQAELERLVQLETGAPFNLVTGPLIRGLLIRLEEENHTLLLTLHHIASDGWSTGLLANELGALYAAFRLGGEDPLAPLKIQYADFSFWQRQWIETGLLREQNEYWQANLKGAPMLLEVPADHPRPAQQSYEGGYVRLVLDNQLTTRIKSFSQRNGTTLFMTMLAAWAVLLSRLAVQQDVVIGTPTANRGYEEIEEIIGFFSNTVALRLDLSGSPTVSDLLQRVKKQAIAAQHYQDLPFEQVVEILRPIRSLSYTPIFQVMFIWGTDQQKAFRLPGLDVQLIPSELTGAKFDLSFSLAEADGIIKGGVQFATSLFEPATIERYLGYFRTLLEGMIVDEGALVDSLPMLSAPERNQLLYGWNDTRGDLPADQSVHGLFEEQVKKTPDAIAAVFDDEQVSYAELNRRANRLAHHLMELGVRADDRVAICVDRSLAMVVALLAVLKAGGAYVPLDPDYPSERLQYMLDDSQPIALLTRAHRQGLFRASSNSFSVVDLDGLEARLQDLPDANPLWAASTSPQQRLAYIIYTSGSTGKPKGAMVPHSGVVNRLLWMQSAYPIGAADAVLQKTPFSFDVSVWEFFWPLFTGARLVLTRPEGHKDPAYLAATIERHCITTLHFVPSMLQVFLEDLAVEQCSTLERVFCSGEALPAALVQRLQRLLPWVKIENLYGPTEAAVDVTSWACPPEFHGSRVPIGRPIANTQLYILDALGEPVPVGVSGELFIGGVGVGRGYWQRPDLTAERFVPDPFGPQAGARLYRTGDLARYLPDGAIEYLGRNDFQVKIRGFRIELGEIEARLAECPGVGEAVVVAREETPGSVVLVAYYVACSVAAAGEAPSASHLRARLAETLPEYMVPAAYVRLDALPLSPNGKLDRRALPAAGRDAFAQQDEEPPQGETETTLAAIWADVLKIDRVGRSDNFFALGGHSLLATRVVTRIRKNFDVDLPIREIFTSPVLSALADRLLTLQLEQFHEADLDLARNHLQLQ